METLGQKLKRLRLAAGYHSQNGFAIAADVSATYIQKLERDAVKKPSVRDLEKIAKQLNVTVDYLTREDVAADEAPQSEEQWVAELIDDLRHRGLPQKQANWLANIAWSMLHTEPAPQRPRQFGTKPPDDTDEPSNSQVEWRKSLDKFDTGDS